MKTTICFLLIFGAILQIAAADPQGLYLRAVVVEGTKGAILMTDEDGQEVYVSSVAIITSDDVESAKLKGEEDVSISFKLTPSGQIKLGEATRLMIGKKMAIIVEGKLLSAPMLQSKISKGFDITGNFTREWANSVVERLNA